MEAIRTVQMQQAMGSETQIFLDITGGYKGLAPFSTLLAFALSARKQVTVCYLYEQSNELFVLPGSDLIHFDLKHFKSPFREEWEKIPPDGLPVAERQRLRDDFIKQVVEKCPDLIQEDGGLIRPTTLARLMVQIVKEDLGDSTRGSLTRPY